MNAHQAIPISADELRQLRESRDELLAALQAILAAPSELEYHVSHGNTCGLCRAVLQAKAAISRATPATLKAQAS